jgi:hypothetical protein
MEVVVIVSHGTANTWDLSCLPESPDHPDLKGDIRLDWVSTQPTCKTQAGKPGVLYKNPNNIELRYRSAISITIDLAPPALIFFLLRAQAGPKHRLLWLRLSFQKCAAHRHATSINPALIY